MAEQEYEDYTHYEDDSPDVYLGGDTGIDEWDGYQGDDGYAYEEGFSGDFEEDWEYDFDNTSTWGDTDYDSFQGDWRGEDDDSNWLMKGLSGLDWNKWLGLGAGLLSQYLGTKGQKPPSRRSGGGGGGGGSKTTKEGKIGGGVGKFTKRKSLMGPSK